MKLFWTEAWDALLSALFPTACVSCKGLVAAHDPPLCPSCWTRLPGIREPVCACGSPLPGSPGLVCGRCRRGRSTISQGASLGVYGGPLRDCVLALKYRGRHKTAERLATRLLANPRCRALLDSADVVIGVPLHPERARERGFNQADLLARALGKRISIPVSSALARTRKTQPQSELGARARRRNVLDAFAVRADSDLKNATVVLIDDVTTTGATLRECASALLACGVREVRSITAARAE